MNNGTITYGQLTEKLTTLGYGQTRETLQGKPTRIYEHETIDGATIFVSDGEEMDSQLKQRLSEMMLSDAPLLSVVEQLREMAKQGTKQEVMQNALEELRNEAKTESEEDRILEVLDFVTGFCAPGRRVWEN